MAKILYKMWIKVSGWKMSKCENKATELQQLLILMNY